MPTIDLLGGKVQIYQRDNSRFWQARASVGGKQRQFSTKQEGQELASRAAEDWYLTLQGKLRAGVLEDGPTFKKAADQFLKEYGVITEGERSEKWTESHAIRLRVHLLPFFGDLPLDKVIVRQGPGIPGPSDDLLRGPEPALEEQAQAQDEAAGAQHTSR